MFLKIFHQVNKTKFRDTNVLEYIRYFGASTISLNFQLSWYFDMVSEASETRGYGFESQSPLI